MEAVFLIILLAVLAGVVWWRLNAKKSAAAGQAERPQTDGGTRTDGALSGGSAAASAEAAGTSGIPGAAGFSHPAEPEAPATADEPAEPPAGVQHAPSAGAQHSGTGSSSVGSAGARSAEGTNREERRIQDEAEWETQWSEASGPAPARESPAPQDAAAHRDGAARQAMAAQAAPGTPAHKGPEAAPSRATADVAGGSRPVHHAEYTTPQAPTLPGAETAAVEEPEDSGTTAARPSAAGSGSVAGQTQTGNTAAAPGGAGSGLPADAAATETQDRTQSSALVEAGADHTQERPAAMTATTPSAGAEPAASKPAGTEPAGHLAAEEPYGAGSASAAGDGSGPADYTVKGDAGAMVYYEEGNPEYEQARADVWFESPAHAEAAGFRAPRRRRV